MGKTITIEFDEECKSCNGTGLYIGMGERDGAAVVCSHCKGTGCFHYKHTYEKFTSRKVNDKVVRVYRVNPGICIGNGVDCSLEDFGGVDYQSWLKNGFFPPKSEMRKYSCPAQWYQNADYDKKPSWDICLGCGAFSSCPHFKNKNSCWERFDKEQKAGGF